MSYKNRRKKKEQLPKEMQDFLRNFEKRFDKDKLTNCDHHNCKQRLSPKQIQVFTMPDLQVKVFCFEHLLDTLYRLDKEKFEQIVNESYKQPLRGTVKMYHELKYSNQTKL